MEKTEYFPLNRDYPQGDYVIAMGELTKNEENIYAKIFKLVKNEIHPKYREQLSENAMNCAVIDFMNSFLSNKE